ncbi:MAG: exonuclease domain-containing protein [Candidatus Dojkabacteria bacterium]
MQEDKKEKILYFDTETTDIQSKDIVQLAILKEDGTTLNMFFNPIQEVSYTAMSIHHLTPELLADYPTFEEAKLPEDFEEKEFAGKDLKEYLEYLSKEYVWVAHNVEFDKEVLGKKGIEIPKAICTFKLARNMLTEEERDLESYALQYLRYYLGLYKKENQDHNTAHDALSDVYFLRDLFKYIQNNSKLSIENMIQISKEPAFIRNISFGKYAGHLLAEIAKEDRGYLEWMLNNITEKEDLRWNIERVLEMGGGTLFD